MCARGQPRSGPRTRASAMPQRLLSAQAQTLAPARAQALRRAAGAGAAARRPGGASRSASAAARSRRRELRAVLVARAVRAELRDVPDGVRADLERLFRREGGVRR